MLKNREGHHSDDAEKGMNCDVKNIALCMAAFRVAALWCTEFTLEELDLEAALPLIEQQFEPLDDLHWFDLDWWEDADLLIAEIPVEAEQALVVEHGEDAVDEVQEAFEIQRWGIAGWVLRLTFTMMLAMNLMMMMVDSLPRLMKPCRTSMFNGEPPPPPNNPGHKTSCCGIGVNFEVWPSLIALTWPCKVLLNLSTLMRIWGTDSSGFFFAELIFKLHETQNDHRIEERYE